MVQSTLLAANAVPNIGIGEVAVRLLVAAALGSAIGLERELREHEAGLRTHLLVAVGSALFTLTSAYGFRDFLVEGGSVVRSDPTRIAAQIVTGIGFIGAGAILRHGMSVRGLTTAATLWVVAAIGLAAGAGYHWAAAVATAIVLFALWPLRYVARDVIDRLRPEEHRIAIELRVDASPAPVLALLQARGLRVEGYDLEDEHDRRIVLLDLDRSPQPHIAALSDLDDVVGVRWNR